MKRARKTLVKKTVTKKTKPRVGILMGSESDRATVSETGKIRGRNTLVGIQAEDPVG